jgi:hypothetical protein
MSSLFIFPKVYLKEGICVPLWRYGDPKLVGFTFLVHLKGLHL